MTLDLIKVSFASIQLPVTLKKAIWMSNPLFPPLLFCSVAAFPFCCFFVLHRNKLSFFYISYHYSDCLLMYIPVLCHFTVLHISINLSACYYSISFRVGFFFFSSSATFCLIKIPLLLALLMLFVACLVWVGQETGYYCKNVCEHSMVCLWVRLLLVLLLFGTFSIVKLLNV